MSVDDAVVLAASSRLTERDRYLIRLVGEHRVLTTGQVCALGFGSVITARHRLGVLAGMGALRRFRPRREVGPAPWHYLLGPLGAALLAAEDRDERKWLPRVREDRQLALARSQRLAHMIGVNWFFAALARHARDVGGELAEWLGEADTAARYNNHAASRYADVALPHPDGSGTWAQDGREVTFVLEFDTGSENLAQVAGKLKGYGRMAGGLADAELACPPLLFCFPGPRRERAARAAFDRCWDAPALRIATTAISPEQASPAGPAWMPLSGTGGPPLRLTRCPTRGSPTATTCASAATGCGDRPAGTIRTGHDDRAGTRRRSPGLGVRVSAGRRAAGAVADSLPVVLLAVIAGAGSFTHIRDTAAEHGQRGPMSWAVAVCVDLTCVMAARERQRDKRHGVTSRRVSWPTIVLAAGVLLSLAANLAQAQPTAWGRVVAAVPAGAFLVAVSMLERRATLQHRHHDHPPPGVPSLPGRPLAPAPGAVPPVPDAVRSVLTGDGSDDDGDGVPPALPPAPVPDGVSPLAEAARRAAAEHYERFGQPITRDALRARLGVSNQAASALLRQIRQDGEAK